MSLKRVCFALLPVVALLATLELAARLWFAGDGATHRRAMVEPDRDLIWKLIPQQSGPFATNELGFRDENPRLDADRRILILGDSVSWGHGVPLERIYPVLLEGLLDRTDPEHRYDVINTGVPGYSTFQELKLLELRGMALQPDLIVLQICLNDVVERYTTVAQFGGRDVFLGVDTRQAIPGVFGWLLRHSRAFAVVATVVADANRDREAFEVANLVRDTLEPELAEAWETVLGEVDEVRSLAAAARIPLLLAVFPYEFQVDGSLMGRQPQDRLLAWASEHGVPVVDVLPPLLSAKRKTHIDPSHLSVAGHEVAAGALVPAVLMALEDAGG